MNKINSEITESHNELNEHINKLEANMNSNIYKQVDDIKNTIEEFGKKCKCKISS